MRRLASIVIVLVGGVAGFQWLSQGFSSTWEPRLRSYLERSAGRATHTSVHVDGVVPAFFHRIRLVNVRVTDLQDPQRFIFQAGEIELTISLIDLPRALLHRKAYEAIGLISLKNPWLRLSSTELARRSVHGRAAAALPPWFTLAWDGGTVQWVDPSLPRGVWTLYQSHGVFRIRGPRMSLSILGAVQEAKSIRAHFSSLGKRWNAQLMVSEGNCQGARDLVETLIHRVLLPPEWRFRGLFDLEVHSSGRSYPAAGDDSLHFLNEVRLSFLGTPAATADHPSVGIAGTLTYRKGHVTSPHLVVESPWADVAGRVDVRLENTHQRPDITLNATLPSGRIGRWPFHDAEVHTRYLDDHWEFLQNTIHLLDGQLSAKGYLGSGSSDVAVTAENLSMGFARLNASSRLKGPNTERHWSGAWGLAGMQQGKISIEDARGNFEVTREHFQAEAKSPNSRFRFSTEGSLSQTHLHLDRLELSLPSGASLAANGTFNRADRQLHGSFDAADFAFPDDLSFLPVERFAIRGVLDAHGRLSGTLEAPSLTGNLQCAQLTVRGEPLGSAGATYVWDKSGFEIPAFHIGTRMNGRYWQKPHPSPEWSIDLHLRQAPGFLLEAFNPRLAVTEGALDGDFQAEQRSSLTAQGSLTLANAKVGKWPVTRFTTRFHLLKERLQIDEWTAETPNAHLQWTGKAWWAKDKKPATPIEIEGQGNLRSPDPADWNLPFRLSGRIQPSDKGWTGQATVSAERPLLQKKQVEPFKANIHWDSRQIYWTEAHWGRHWMSRGSLQWDKDPALWSAQIQADHVLLEEWQPLLWPALKEIPKGSLSGVFNLTGTATQPQGDLSFHIENGLWRAFQFSTDVSGRWGLRGIKPLVLKGRFKTGGDFEFSGLLTPDKEAQGTLKLTGFNLQPLGESLGFPKPLDGITMATLTLNGPLARLHWNGHLSGGPIVYGGAGEHTFKLEEITTDMTLAPLENDPSVAHLTLTEGEAKTAEELIRFQSGSFLEFAGDKPARIKVGTEIRNLHLGPFTLFGGLDLDGLWQIKPAGFSIQTKAQTRSLFINDYELQEGLVIVNYYDGTLTFPAPPNAPALVTGAIDFRAVPQLRFTDFFISGKNQEGIQFSGDIGPSLWDFKMRGKGLDMGILAELAGFPYPMSGAADVQVRGTGDTKHPHVDGKVALDRGTALGLAFRSGNASFIWQDARISFTQLSLTDPGRYTLEGAGVFPLMSKDKTRTQDHTIDFSVRLKDATLGLLQSMFQEVKQAKGPVEGLLQIKGTMEDPDLHGSLHVTNGTVLGAHYFHELRNAYLTVDFEGDTVRIRDLRGRSGDGEFLSSGTITLAGWQPSRYDLSMDVISSKGVDVQVPELAIPESPLAKRFRFLTSSSRGEVRGHVTLRGPAEAPVFSGVGIISNGHFTFPPSRKSPPSAAILDWFRRITWDVVLKFQDGAWFDNELVQASVAGDLKLKGPSDKLRVDGGLDINEGKISYLGLQFDVQQAHYDVRSEISGETAVNTPYVRGVAECQIQAVDTVSGVAGASGGSRLSVNDVITLNLDYAPVDQIKPRLTSAANPTLSQDKLLARVTQTDVGNLTPQERTYLYQKQILSLIDNSLTTPLAQNVLKKTGIADRVRVQHVFDPNSVAAQDLNAASAAQQQSSGVSLFANSKYTIEKDISRRLSLGYGIKFVPSTQVDPGIQQPQKLDLVSDVQLSYRWFRNIYLRGDFELPTSNPNILPDRKVTIEPRWKFGWWGNTNKDKEKPKAP